MVDSRERSERQEEVDAADQRAAENLERVLGKCFLPGDLVRYRSVLCRVLELSDAEGFDTYYPVEVIDPGEPEDLNELLVRGWVLKEDQPVQALINKHVLKLVGGDE